MIDPNMNGPRPSSTGSNVAKGIGFGCGGIFLFGALVIASFTHDYSGFLVFLAIYVVLIVLSIRSSQKRGAGIVPTPEPGAPSSPSVPAMPAQYVAPAPTNVNPSLRERYLSSP